MRRDRGEGRASGGTEVVLDLSRLLSRVLRTTPTGIDRVELVYALGLLDRIPERLSFGARYPYGVYGRLSLTAVRQFLTTTAALWRNGDRVDRWTLQASAARHLTALRPRIIPRARGPRVFLQSSPHHLEDGGRMGRILAREHAAFVCLVHDVIPVTHPEYARENGAAVHLRRIDTIARHASGIITNSVATRDALAPFLDRTDRPRRVAVAHLGTEIGEDRADAPAQPGDRPYFVCVATIEPRKNHLLLLNVWKRLVEEMGPAAPKLILIGRRGWENEQVVDMLERCVPLQGVVEEYSSMSDRRMFDVLRGARALLLPSFAEGFGMPVSEALALGVPVIASDLLPLREVGLDVPDYIDPLDGIAWMTAIRDYARADSPARAAQLGRLPGWLAPGWSDHLDIVLDVVDSI
ncbi:glycosyl transferase [Sphingomonas sp. Leaf17]|uniref:glycosyltransferase family 4 protein n=1 Tax=Sphingomonas sp. Leaf17 TaxID=1735683 RepID=UPI0006FEE0AC|nr:glycosyltransferase family 1 protein [Sphingomonas sp. Leaf17]KQM68143.1 glycosyl transferase [Sphingomonas sp. Leaf17]